MEDWIWVDEWINKKTGQTVSEWPGQGTRGIWKCLGRAGGPKIVCTCAELAEADVTAPTRQVEVSGRLVIRYRQTVEPEPRCEEAKVYQPNSWGVRSKEGRGLDATNRTNMFEPGKNSRSVSAHLFLTMKCCLSLSRWRSHLGFYTLFLSPGVYQRMQQSINLRVVK